MKSFLIRSLKYYNRCINIEVALRMNFLVKYTHDTGQQSFKGIRYRAHI